MRNQARYKKAKQLRDSGFLYKDIAKELGVSITRVRTMVIDQERREQRLKLCEHKGCLLPANYCTTINNRDVLTCWEHSPQ